MGSFMSRKYDPSDIDNIVRDEYPTTRHKMVIDLNNRHLTVVVVEIVMLEKLDCILSKRAARPIYMKVQVRLNAISPYQSQQSSPAIRDISVSGHTRHLRLRPYEIPPSPVI